MSDYSQKVYGRDYVEISHDGFARQSIVRRIVWVNPYSKTTCNWCGNLNRYGSLFQYGTMPEDSGRTHWHRGLFCCKPCHDSYHF